MQASILHRPPPLAQPTRVARAQTRLAAVSGERRHHAVNQQPQIETKQGSAQSRRNLLLAAQALVAGVIMQEQPARAERGACNPCVPSDEHVPSISVLHLSLCAKLDRLVQIHKKEGATHWSFTYQSFWRPGSSSRKPGRCCYQRAHAAEMMALCFFPCVIRRFKPTCVLI